MPKIIVGTAGHVDHGKTLLVKALTGIDADRLKEEQERGISIELGFAPLVLPDGRTLGIIDVPGHEKFIKNMLAGVAGIDLVLLVIAADEGIMPQTKEHLDIIDLLQVKKGIIVITKKDLVDDEWLEITELEIRDAVKNTVLQDAPMIAVSAVTGAGLNELKLLLGEVALQTSPRSAGGKARLPIDRVFSITGFGTVVTGTLWAGSIRVGDNVEILPQALKTKVRGLQVHSKKVEVALAGQRVAVNLASLEVGEIARGSVLASPDYLKYTYRFDAKVRVLPKAYQIIKNLDRVRIFLGTKEVLGKVRLMDRDEISEEGEAFAQFYLEEPHVAARGDRFVIRSYSPMHTIAGGIIIDPLATKHQRFLSEVTEGLEKIEKGDPKELIQEYLNTKGQEITQLKTMARNLNMEEKDAEVIVGILGAEKKLIILGKGIQDGFLSDVVFNDWFHRVEDVLLYYHKSYPLRLGISKEELRSREFPGLEGKGYNFLVDEWCKANQIHVQGQFVSLYGWKPVATSKEEEFILAIISEIQVGGLHPETPMDIVQKLKIPQEDQGELLQYIVNSDTVVRLDEDLYISKENLVDAIDKLTAYALEHHGITLAQARDVLDSSRKYVLPILEYMDEKRFTKRIGEKRVALKKG